MSWVNFSIANPFSSKNYLPSGVLATKVAKPLIIPADSATPLSVAWLCINEKRAS
jgi:hypothetical protein